MNMMKALVVEKPHHAVVKEVPIPEGWERRNSNKSKS